MNNKLGTPKKATPAQIAASRRNGAKSRGPITLTGKERSRLNAVTHGFFVKVLNPKDTVWDSRNEYNQLILDLIDCFQAESDYEIHIIELLALDYVRLRRVLHLEDACLDVPLIEDIKTPNPFFSKIEPGTPAQHRYQLLILERIEMALEQNQPLLLDEQDAIIIASTLRPVLKLPISCWMNYIPGLKRSAKIQDVEIEELDRAVVDMLCSGKKVAAKQKPAWTEAVKKAAASKKRDLHHAKEREKAMPKVARDFAKDWMGSAGRSEGRTASLNSLHMYETNIRRSIERGVKMLIDLKTVRRHWKEEDQRRLEKFFQERNSLGSFPQSLTPNFDSAEHVP